VAHGLTVELLKAGARVRRLFRAGRRTPWLESANAENVVGDVTNLGDLERALDGVDVVFHLAGQTSVYVAERDPVADFDANVRPVMALIDLCARKSPAPTLILAGTATEIGLTTGVPVDPAQRDAPVTIYDLHKLMAEQYLELATRVQGLTGTTLRLCNVYGPGPPSGSSDRGVLNQMVRRALHGEALTVYGEGNQIRDYVYVSDVARAFVAAAEASAATSGRHFVIGTGRGHRVRDALSLVAEIVGQHLGRSVDVRTVPSPENLAAIEHRSFVADPEPFARATGFRPEVTLEQGIARTLAHFVSTGGAK
jgi:nucleoside-diphosphate-sugar epimerase